jgi:hypothetical protein
MKAGPIGSRGGTFGHVILVALLRVHGYIIDSPPATIRDLEFEAVMATNSGEFLQAFDFGTIRLKRALEIPPIARLLPNMHVRFQMLRVFPIDHRLPMTVTFGDRSNEKWN